MKSGSCHCRKVSFEVEEPLSNVYKCYCETCRKLSGSAFPLVARVRKTNFRIAKGEDALYIYESKPGKNRYYCKRCCSPIYVTVESQPEFERIRMGVLDFEPNIKTVGHIWVSEKPGWQEITDSLPKFSEWNA